MFVKSVIHRLKVIFRGKTVKWLSKEEGEMKKGKKKEIDTHIFPQTLRWLVNVPKSVHYN